MTRYESVSSGLFFNCRVPILLPFAQDDVPQVLDDQLKELSYYGAVDGGQVLVFDAQ